MCMDGNAYRIYIMTHIFRKDTSTTCNRLMVESNHCFIDMKHITDSAMFHVLQQFLKLQTYSFQFPRYSFARLVGSYAGPSYKQAWLWIWIKKIKPSISYRLLDFISNETGSFIVLEGTLGVKYPLIMNSFFFKYRVIWKVFYFSRVFSSYYLPQTNGAILLKKSFVRQNMPSEPNYLSVRAFCLHLLPVSMVGHT